MGCKLLRKKWINDFSVDPQTILKYDIFGKILLLVGIPKPYLMNVQQQPKISFLSWRYEREMQLTAECMTTAFTARSRFVMWRVLSRFLSNYRKREWRCMLRDGATELSKPGLLYTSENQLTALRNLNIMLPIFKSIPLWDQPSAQTQASYTNAIDQ